MSDVRIVSPLHPLGRHYRLAGTAEMAPDVVGRLHRVAATAVKRARLSPRRERRAFVALGRVVAIVLPELEPEILKRLSWDDRAAIVQTWLAAEREEVSSGVTG